MIIILFVISIRTIVILLVLIGFIVPWIAKTKTMIVVGSYYEALY